MTARWFGQSESNKTSARFVVPGPYERTHVTWSPLIIIQQQNAAESSTRGVITFFVLVTGTSSSNIPLHKTREQFVFESFTVAVIDGTVVNGCKPTTTTYHADDASSVDTI